ncbi:hypothetical protein CK203_028970 [Vitis vinifera]|uniref:Uncharacterized protein n=1 Tax=Vitis vinifera TaxID=29760 RepID=A0A438IMU6_VITVI|nr:hypothetical protein CK203_028970 [Vitis vinifera]
MQDRKASLSRARREAALADGISWGMGEDAIEEPEDDADEVTWQTYKGQLTEKQEKTRDKIIKRTEKASNRFVTWRMRLDVRSERFSALEIGILEEGRLVETGVMSLLFVMIIYCPQSIWPSLLDIVFSGF